MSIGWCNETSCIENQLLWARPPEHDITTAQSTWRSTPNLLVSIMPALAPAAAARQQNGSYLIHSRLSASVAGIIPLLNSLY